MNTNENVTTSHSQNEQIKEHLLNGGKITSLEALNQFNCLRLSGRIYDLRERGLEIRKETVIRNGKRIAEYSL